MATNTIPGYISEESDVDIPNDEEALTSKRRAKRSRNWDLVDIFKTKQEALHMINKEDIWSYAYVNKTNDGKKIYYRCNKAKKRTEQCPAGLYLFIDNKSEDVHLFKTEEQHEHQGLEKSNRLSEQMKEEIKKLFEFNLKPKKIWDKLTEKGLHPKNKAQVTNYLYQLKQLKYGSTKISLGELESWCIKNSNIPESDDASYVAGHKMIYDDDSDDSENEDDDDKGSKFRVFITTKRLLKIAAKAKTIHADATYKLVWEGMPVMIVGTSDMDRHFHPFGISVCSNETTSDFTFIFQSIVDSANNLNEIVKPETLVSDASPAIRNAYLNVFGESQTLIMCWAHMRRCVTKHLNLVDDEYKDNVIDDIENLQLAQNSEIFQKAMELFNKKWNQKKQKRFVDYMNEMWFNTHQNWYEGVKEKTPSTNNCLESFNLVIKKEDTLRERLPLPRFFSLCLESVYKWSNHYVNGLKQYINSPTINLKDWTSGYQWAKSNKIVTSQGLVNSIVYYCPPNDEVKVTNEEIINTKEKNWRSFEQFKKRAFSVWIVELPKEATQWQEGRCTCPSFFKKYICKHIIGLAIRLKYVKPPPNAKDCPINHKRRRGRPNKSSKALFID
jgi:hypothetical protein